MLWYDICDLYYYSIEKTISATGSGGGISALKSNSGAVSGSSSSATASNPTSSSSSSTTAATGSSLDKTLELLKGPKAVSTIAKSSMDWDNYKEENKLEDDLAVAAKDG